MTVRSAVRGLSSPHRARPPPASPGARKHSVPNRVHSVGHDLWLASPSGFASINGKRKRVVNGSVLDIEILAGGVEFLAQGADAASGISGSGRSRDEPE